MRRTALGLNRTFMELKCKEGVAKLAGVVS